MIVRRTDRVLVQGITGKQGTVTEGGATTYTIVVRNSGPSNVTGASVTIAAAT